MHSNTVAYEVCIRGGEVRHFETLQDYKILTFRNNRSPCPVIVNYLDVSKMDVTEKDAVGPSGVLTVVKGQGDDILEKSRIFKRLDG